MKKEVEELPRATNRPHVPATKRLDLSGEAGKRIIEKETRRVLELHAKTFDKLSKL